MNDDLGFFVGGYNVLPYCLLWWAAFFWWAI